MVGPPEYLDPPVQLSGRIDGPPQGWMDPPIFSRSGGPFRAPPPPPLPLQADLLVLRVVVSSKGRTEGEGEGGVKVYRTARYFLHHGM